MKLKKMEKNLMIATSLLTGFLFTIVIIVMIFDFNHSTFKLSKLTKFIKQEDNYLEVNKYYNLDIKTTNDTININISNDQMRDSLVGTLYNDILTFEISKDDENILLKGKLLYSVADSIGQINGNGKGYVSSVLGNLDYSKINIKHNGIEIYSDGSKNIYKFKVNKKFSLGSTADVYFTSDDFLKLKNELLGDGFAQTAKGNLIFYKINDRDKKIIYFGEPDSLTTRTYNSLISLIEVMYDSNTSNLFGKAYKKLENGSYNNFTMIVNYEPTEDEVIYNKLLSNYKILKLEIN